MLMSREEFLRQQYLTLRDEITRAKARSFWMLIAGAVFIPLASFAADELSSTFANACVPFIVLVIILAFTVEQHTIIRAGRYIREQIEPQIEGVTGWECWLESNRKLREMDRYFIGTFLAVFFVFYGVATAAAVNSMSHIGYSYYQYAGLAYLAGGVWLLVVLLRHWQSFTTTKPASEGDEAQRQPEPADRQSVQPTAIETGAGRPV
jgi:hypothetical protein